MIRGTPWRQSAQFGALQRDQLLAPGIAAANEVGDPIAIDLEAVEVSAAAQQQGLSNGTLEVTVLALDRAVLVRYAAERLSERCSAGVPPSDHSAFCRPQANAV